MTDAKQLFQVQTSDYRPPGLHLTPWLYMNLPLFTLQTVEMMRRDPQVRLAMSIKTAPLLKLKAEVSGRADIKQFVVDTIREFWKQAIPEVACGMWYTCAGGEVIYKQKQGKVHFDSMKPIYPKDITVLTRKGVKWGIEIPARSKDASAKKQIVLEGMKSFLYVHRREFSSWLGQSEFEGAYEPWMEKCDRSGAKAIRKLWFYKNAFDSGVMWHPPGTYVDAAGTHIPYRDLARQALELLQTGGVLAMESTVDPDSKNPLWRYDRPQINGGGDMLLQYPKELDTEILRGMEIPDDVISQVSGTGSFAGRTIPLISFLTSQNHTLVRMFMEFQKQVLEPLVWLNFESHDWEVQTAEINIGALMPSAPGEGGEPQPPEPQEPPPEAPPQQMSMSELDNAYKLIGDAIQMSAGHDVSSEKRDSDGKWTAGGATKVKAADRKFETAGEAIKSGRSIAAWRNAASDAFVKEEIDDDHPGYKAILHGTAPSLDEWSKAAYVYGHHVQTSMGHYGKVTDISDDGKVLTVTHENGETSRHLAIGLQHLGDKIAHDSGKGRDVSHASAYLAPYLAAEAMKNNENISVQMRRLGIDPVKGRQLRAAIMDEMDKLREKLNTPSDMRAKAQERSKEVNAKEST